MHDLQAYWLLLAISQDHPKDAHVVALRDACEQAALEGHWQLPFKQSRLPPPLSASPARRRGDGGRTPVLLSPSDSFSARRSVGGMPLSPGGDSRPMSPDGLGGGLYSSVFMDTGVEGLIYSSPPPESREEEPRDLRAIRWARYGRCAALPSRQCLCLACPTCPACAFLGVLATAAACCVTSIRATCANAPAAGPLHGRAQHCSCAALPAVHACRQRVAGSPRASQGALLEGPGRPLLPLRVDMQRVSSPHEELGAGEGVSALLLRSAVAGENGGPGVVQQSEARAAAGGSVSPAASLLLSPPNSPRRRQTTFGATLDFVETLCQASSSLTAFQREPSAAEGCFRCSPRHKSPGSRGLRPGGPWLAA